MLVTSSASARTRKSSTDSGADDLRTPERYGLKPLIPQRSRTLLRVYTYLPLNETCFFTGKFTHARPMQYIPTCSEQASRSCMASGCRILSRARVALPTSFLNYARGPRVAEQWRMPFGQGGARSAAQFPSHTLTAQPLRAGQPRAPASRPLLGSVHASLTRSFTSRRSNVLACSPSFKLSHAHPFPLQLHGLPRVRGRPLPVAPCHVYPVRGVSWAHKQEKRRKGSRFGKRGKLKTCKAVAKRFLRTGSGKLKYWPAGKVHNMLAKSRKRRRQLRKPRYVDKTRLKILNKMLSGW